MYLEKIQLSDEEISELEEAYEDTGEDEERGEPEDNRSYEPLDDDEIERLKEIKERYILQQRTNEKERLKSLKPEKEEPKKEHSHHPELKLNICGNCGKPINKNNQYGFCCRECRLEFYRKRTLQICLGCHREIIKEPLLINGKPSRFHSEECKNQYFERLHTITDRRKLKPPKNKRKQCVEQTWDMEKPTDEEIEGWKKILEKG